MHFEYLGKYIPTSGNDVLSFLESKGDINYFNFGPVKKDVFE